MAFIEIIGIVIIVLLIGIWIKLNKGNKGTTGGVELADNLLLGQLKNIEKTLVDKSKEDKERQDKVMKCVEDNIASFTRTIHGTKRRGKVGEAILKQILAEPIASGLVVTDLNTDKGSVEFAWDIKNGKYLPIDSKMPELDELYGKFSESDKPDEQVNIKKDILKILEKRKKEIKRYLNNQNTIDKCIVAIPDAIADQFPDINKDSIKTGVFVTGYTKVFLFAVILAENYVKMLSLGNIGLYKQTINAVKNILSDIEKKSGIITKGVTQITNANAGIKTEVGKSLNKINQVSSVETKATEEIE